MNEDSKDNLYDQFMAKAKKTAREKRLYEAMEYLKSAQRFRKTEKVARRIEALQKIIDRDENSSEESEEEVSVKEEVFVKKEPEPMCPSPEHQSPWATEVRISKTILERILNNPKSFTLISSDDSPENCQYLKIFEPTDYSVFPGGRQFRTKIGNEFKLIYSYTPGSYEKYLDMITAKEVTNAPTPPQNDQPPPERSTLSPEPRTPEPKTPEPRTPSPEPEQSDPAPKVRTEQPNESQVNSDAELPEVFLIYDNSTGQTIHAVKGEGGIFQPIGQSKGKIINVGDGQSGSIMTGNNDQCQEDETNNEETEEGACSKDQNPLKRKAEPIRNGLNHCMKDVGKKGKTYLRLSYLNISVWQICSVETNCYNSGVRGNKPQKIKPFERETSKRPKMNDTKAINVAKINRESGKTSFINFMNATQFAKKIDFLNSAIRHFTNAYKTVEFLRSRPGIIEKVSISKSLSNCYNRLGELYYNLAKEENLPCDAAHDVEAMFTKLKLEKGAVSSFEQAMVNFVEAVRYGAWSCDFADSIETDLKKENDKKIAVCINALEQIKEISRADYDFTFKEIALRYLSAGLLLLPENLQVKAVSLMEVCQQLNYEGLKYKDYLREIRATPYENIENVRTWFQDKTRLEMLFLKEIESLLPHVNKDVLSEEKKDELNEMLLELEDNLSRTAGLQKLYQARELMSRAIKNKRKQAGVIDALDLMKSGYDQTIDIDQKARCVIAAEMAYVYVEYDERPHAKIKAKEYYKECMRLALENGYTKEFYWLKRAREYLAKVAAEMTHFGVTFKPSKKGAEVIDRFKKENFSSKPPTKFLNYLAKNHPPKRGTMPRVTGTPENIKDCLTKATRLYHPDRNSKYDEDWKALCEQISMVANNLYSGSVKGI